MNLCFACNHQNQNQTPIRRITAQGPVECSVRLDSGELRVKNTRQCLDIEGTNGDGKVYQILYSIKFKFNKISNLGWVQTERCDGHLDQQFFLCSDGTIRNEARNYCLIPDTKQPHSWVRSAKCQQYPSTPKRYKWKYGRTREFTDRGKTGQRWSFKWESVAETKPFSLGGIKQISREILNQETGACLDVNWKSGSFNWITTYDCENLDD